jgi:probable non-F420 flavinoid oxidoreductase
MVMIGFHASHEQIAPGELLEAVRAAETAGFDAAMCSDHLAPWGRRQGHSGHAWSWLGAALQSTLFSIGVVSAPGQRYHPAVAAQAYATLADMFPGRFWVALGSGEALNEHVTGQTWPDKSTRDDRLLEVVGVIRGLLDGEEVTHRGLVTVDQARVWSLPRIPPLLLGAAISEETATRVGGWADGLITVNQPPDRLRRVVSGFRRGGGMGKPMYLQVHLSWAEDEEEARRIAHEQWRTNVFGSDLATELPLPEHFDAAAEFVTPSDVEGPVLISSDLSRHTTWLSELAELGFERLYLHHVGQDQQRFIDAFGAKVIPELTS